MASPNLRSAGRVLFAWIALALASCGTTGALPTLEPRAVAPSDGQNRVERVPVCVGSTIHSAGALADVLYYERVELDDGRVAVGYYAFFSEERPWGNNWMTWTVLPALAVDLVYTRTMLVWPGLQRVAYGEGDVEGFHVLYEVGESGELVAQHAIADDGVHTEQVLSREDLYAVDPDRMTVYTDGWSHHLAARGAKSPSDLAYRRCYGPEQIRPLTSEVVRAFRLDGRARPAAVAARYGTRGPTRVAWTGDPKRAR